MNQESNKKESTKQAKIAKYVAVFGFALATAAFVGGCGSSGQPSASAGGSADDALVVGTNATFVPFESKNKDGQLEGFDIDLVKAIGQKLHKKVEFKNIAFDSLIPALGTKQINMAASGMTITKPRAEKVEFSVPYYKSTMAILIKKGSNIHSVDDLKGKTLAVQLATTSEDLGKTVPQAKLKEFDHSNEEILELKKGGVDAAILDMPVAQYYVSSKGDKDLEVVAWPDTEKYFGLAMNKDDKKLAAEVNKAIEEMKADGEFNALYQKWFHVDAPKMPEKPLTWDK